jgi:hypothetical protein
MTSAAATFLLLITIIVLAGSALTHFADAVAELTG